MVEISPLRDVLISLLANLAAWAVGVFIAYFSHDPDPDFMDATLQHKRASRAYYRSRHRTDNEIKTVEAKFGKEMEQMERAAGARSANVAVERGLLEQINKQENGVIEAVTSALHTNAQHYRDALAQIALGKRGEVSILRLTEDGEKPMTPYEYKAMDIEIDSDSVRGLV
jgi:major membrane immunogen (membrane-anchored lipoprotein)